MTRFSSKNPMLYASICLMVAVGALTASPAGAIADTSPQKPALGNYVLGPDDVILILAPNLEELNKQQFRIDLQGNIDVPLVGQFKASGLTLDRLKADLTQKLERYLVQPDISLSIADFRSQPISVIGAVNRPGVHQLQGHKTLIEVLSMGEGLRPDAGDNVVVTRKMEYGAIPLASAVKDPSSQFTTVKISSKALSAGQHPLENIEIMPDDVISVPKAETIYVIGSVKRPGGFVINGKETISTLEALSLAEGVDRTAATSRARIIRRDQSGTKTEIPVNLKRVLDGKSTDVMLQADDILFVPNSAGKSVALRTVEAAIQAGTGFAIYHP